MRSKLNIWLALVVLALVPALAGAQDTTAKIHGHAQDPANAPIANAQVILSTDGKTPLFTFTTDANGDYKGIVEGDTVKTTGRILEVPVGPELLGRVVDSLGAPIDGKGPINAALKAPLERVAPGVIFRKSVKPGGHGNVREIYLDRGRS